MLEFFTIKRTESMFFNARMPIDGYLRMHALYLYIWHRVTSSSYANERLSRYAVCSSHRRRNSYIKVLNNETKKY
jgi:hypothetical protein